jgi:hypothetical protein
VLVALLDVSEPEQVLDLIDDGRISHAWDLRAARSAKRAIRVWSWSLCQYLEGPKEWADLPNADVFARLFPDCEGPTIPAAEVARSWLVSSDHVLNLIRAGELRTIRGGVWRRGPHGSPQIQTESIVRFLDARRL